MENASRFNGSWRDAEGKWHDNMGRVWDRRRDQLEHRANECGCGQCVKMYENYIYRVIEDQLLVRSAIATLSLNWQMLNNPEHTRFRIDPEDSEVFPVSDDYPDGDDVIDFSDTEDGTIEDEQE